MRTISFILFLVMSTLCNAQKIDYVIKKNGDSIKIKSFTHKQSKDILKITEYGTNVKLEIPIYEIDKLTSNEVTRYIKEDNANFRFNTWKFVNIKGKKNLLSELVEGKCSLYLEFTGEYYNFFVKRDVEENATLIQKMSGFGNKFNKKGAKYFEDCPELIQLLSESKYKTRFDFLVEKITEIVNFYNKNC